MRIRGIKFKCDRCGKEEFFELDENGEFKHGCSFHIFSLMDDTHLCDDCHNKLYRIVDEFMKENADD
jgi:hypothetical protein